MQNKLQNIYISENTVIQTQLSENSIKLTKKQILEKKNFWRNYSKVHNLHNGRNISCTQIESSVNKIDIKFIKLSYSSYSYIRHNELNIKGGYLAGIQTCIYDTTKNGWLFVKRSNSVGFDYFSISLVGGAIPYSKNFSTENIYEQARKEIFEEILFEKIEMPHLFNICYDSNLHVNFGFMCIAKDCSLIGNENSELISVPNIKLKTFISNPKYTFAKFTQNHVLALIDSKRINDLRT